MHTHPLPPSTLHYRSVAPLWLIGQDAQDGVIPTSVSCTRPAAADGRRGQGRAGCMRQLSLGERVCTTLPHLALERYCACSRQSSSASVHHQCRSPGRTCRSQDLCRRHHHHHTRTGSNRNPRASRPHGFKVTKYLSYRVFPRARAGDGGHGRVCLDPWWWGRKKQKSLTETPADDQIWTGIDAPHLQYPHLSTSVHIGPPLAALLLRFGGLAS